MKKPAEQKWYVYIAECRNKAYYTGITTDIERRISEHNSGTGCRYTRSFGPVVLLWKEKQPDRASALKKEALIKSWARNKKGKVIK
ncbi:MAG: GIY-YIG nuclease family protein, partial [Elusimicrobiota bacterium]